jgi:hypothetical protein
MATLSPHYEFFAHYVDTGMEIELLREFAVQIDDLLRDASIRIPAHELELRPALAAIADDRAYLYTEVFPRLLHESFLISTVVVLEREFREFVHILRKVTASSLTLADLSGSTPERFRTYCQKVCRFDPSLSNQQWQDLMGLIEVRNCLVHSSGCLAPFARRAAIQAFARRHSAVQIEDDRLILSKATSELSLSLLEGLVETISLAAFKRYPREATERSGT